MIESERRRILILFSISSVCDEMHYARSKRENAARLWKRVYLRGNGRLVRLSGDYYESDLYTSLSRKEFPRAFNGSSDLNDIFRNFLFRFGSVHDKGIVQLEYFKIKVEREAF
jgi:hypothetical protein